LFEKKTFRRLRIFFSKKDIARTVEYAISFVGIFTINAFSVFNPSFHFRQTPPLLKRSSKSKMRFTENGEGVGQGFAAAIPPFQ
jgi:hypothetical protein